MTHPAIFLLFAFALVASVYAIATSRKDRTHD